MSDRQHLLLPNAFRIMDATNDQTQWVRRMIAFLDTFGPRFDDGRDQVNCLRGEIEAGSAKNDIRKNLRPTFVFLKTKFSVAGRKLAKAAVNHLVCARRMLAVTDH